MDRTVLRVCVQAAACEDFHVVRTRAVGERRGILLQDVQDPEQLMLFPGCYVFGQEWYAGKCSFGGRGRKR
jgi:hypothetical protein